MSALMTVEEVAERWHVTARAVRDEINRKRLRAMKIGGRWLVDATDVAAFEDARANMPRTPKRTREPRRRG